MNRPPIAIPHVAGGHRFWDAAQNLADMNLEAVEWNIGVARPPVSASQRKRVFAYIDSLAERHCFHAPVTDIELAHTDPEVLQLSRLVMKQAIDFVGDRERGEHITFHIADPAHEREGNLSWDRAVESLNILAEHAEKRGVKLALENLRFGWTANPDTLLRLAEEGGVSLTFDSGHAAGGSWVKEGHGTPVDFLKKILPKVITVHLYEIEVDTPERPSKHLPPTTLDNLAPVLETLLESGCPWWTIELPDRAEFAQTYAMFTRFIEERQSRNTGPAR